MGGARGKKETLGYAIQPWDMAGLGGASRLSRVLPQACAQVAGGDREGIGLRSE